MSSIEDEIGDIAPDGIMVIVEHGPEFQKTPRLEAALEELAAALEDREMVEVAGFDMELMRVGQIEGIGGDPMGFKFPINVCKGWKICGNCTKTVNKALEF